MFRNIQDRFVRRLENIKNKNQTQIELDKNIRSFLIKEFGPIGESLSFKASQENKKIYIRFQNKTVSNEVVLRSGKLRESLRTHDHKIETINID